MQSFQYFSNCAIFKYCIWLNYIKDVKCWCAATLTHSNNYFTCFLLIFCLEAKNHMNRPSWFLFFSFPVFQDVPGAVPQQSVPSFSPAVSHTPDTHTFILWLDSCFHCVNVSSGKEAELSWKWVTRENTWFCYFLFQQDCKRIFVLFMSVCVCVNCSVV